MTVRDSCFILSRFPAGDNSLISRVYCKILGQKSLLLPEYFLYEKYPLGSFELFNTGEFYITEWNNSLVVEDIISYRNNALKISRNLKRFLFLSKISKAVTRFAKEGDEEIFQLLLRSLNIEGNFDFNYIRFLINFSAILGFSPDNLKKPGWINLITLTSCKEEELKKGYCIYISPKEFAILKAVSQRETKPFEISQKVLEGLERFFYRFLKFQTENF